MLIKLLYPSPRMCPDLALGEMRYGPPQWPPGAKKRRIDGVRLLAPPPGLSDGIYWFVRDGGHLIAYLIAGARVEVIEVKQELNDEVLGQVIANADLLEM